MYNNRTMTIEHVLANPEEFKSSTFGKYEETAKMELVQDDPECSIPAVHYSWNQEHSFYVEDVEKQKKLRAAGFEGRDCEGISGGKPYVSFHIMEVRVSHLWFMNFRRYSWSWTTEMKGSGGYGYGHVYANGTAIAGLATTPAEVIRDSLVISWAEIRDGKHLPKVFLCREAEAVLKILLDEAIQHASDHARPSHNSGPAVGFLPEMIIHAKDGAVLKQNARKTVYSYENRVANNSIFGV